MVKVKPKSKVRKTNTEGKDCFSSSKTELLCSAATVNRRKVVFFFFFFTKARPLLFTVQETREYDVGEFQGSKVNKNLKLLEMFLSWFTRGGK